jgi:hypothetical protein
MAVRSSLRWAGRLSALVVVPFIALTVVGAATTPASAQAIGTDPSNKRCQTLLTCNYSRRGGYRGCLSSYTCRICRPQRVRCTASDIASGRRQCTELVCTWGG